jgi:hypothetical protein
MIALLAVPALAQERWQVGLGLNASSGVTITGHSRQLSSRVERKAKAATALHAGYRLHDLGASDLSVTGEYQFKSKEDLDARVDGNGMGSARGTSSFRTTFFAPGIQWNFHKAVDFGFGLQYRFTRLEADSLEVRTRYDRPWLLAYVGYTFKTGNALRPYVALRLAGTPVTTGAQPLRALDDRPGQERWMKSLAGDREASLQVGLRF